MALQAREAHALSQAITGIDALVQPHGVKIMLALHDGLLLQGKQEVLEDLWPEIQEIMSKAWMPHTGIAPKVTMRIGWGE